MWAGLDLGRPDLSEDEHEVWNLAQIAILKPKLARPWLLSIRGCKHTRKTGDGWKRTFALVSAQVPQPANDLEPDERRVTPWTP